MAGSAFRDRMLAATRVVRSEESALKRQIGKLYEDCAADLERTIRRYGTDSLTGKRADALQRNMRVYTRHLWEEVQGATESAVRRGAEIGVTAQTSMFDDLLHGIGYTTKQSFSSAFGRTQDEAVAAVLNGSIYRGRNAALSRRIWNNEALLNGQLERVIVTAAAEGRSAVQLARDLGAYVNPKAQMPDYWNDIYPCPFPHKVDYNAKRLAVTALNHAYYQGTIMAARENPFAEYLHWEVSSMHLIYDVCDTYQEHDEGLGIGNYRLDNAPLPHPFCRCNWYVDSSKSLKEIGEEIGDWVAGAENARLDRAFAEWAGKDVATSEALVYNNDGKNLANEVFERPFAHGKMHVGDRFIYAGKTVTFEGWSGEVETIAGKGCRRKIDIIDVIVDECKGRPSDWTKRKCWAYVTVDDIFGEADIHWLENSVIGKYYGGKVKYDAETGEWFYPSES